MSGKYLAVSKGGLLYKGRDAQQMGGNYINYSTEWKLIKGLVLKEIKEWSKWWRNSMKNNWGQQSLSIQGSNPW